MESFKSTSVTVLILFILFTVKNGLAQNPVIEITKNPTEQILEFDYSNNTLGENFNFKAINFNPKNKRPDTIYYDNNEFTLICNNKNYTKSFGKNYEGKLPFSKDLPKFKIFFTPKFKNNKIKQIYFYSKDNKEILFKGIAKYSFLKKPNTTKFNVEINTKKDSVIKTISIENIGLDTLKVNLVVSNNNICTLKNKSITVLPKSKIETDLLFKIPKNIFKEKDTIVKNIKITIQNQKYKRNNYTQSFNVKLIKNKINSHIYIPWLIATLLLLTFIFLFIFLIKPSTKYFKYRLKKLYRKNKDSTNKKEFIEHKASKLLLKSKKVTNKIECFIDQSINFAKGEILNSSNLDLPKNGEHNEEINNAFLKAKEEYLKPKGDGSKKPNQNTEEVKNILKDFLKKAFNSFSENYSNNKLNNSIFSDEIDSAHDKIKDLLSNNELEKVKKFIENYKSKLNINNEDEIIKQIDKAVDICLNVNNKSLINTFKSKNYIECINILEKDSKLIEILTTKYEKDKEDIVDFIIIEITTLVDENKELKEFPLSHQFKHILLKIDENIDKIRTLDWSANFKKPFFEHLGYSNNLLKDLIKELNTKNLDDSNTFKEYFKSDKMQKVLINLMRLNAFSVSDFSYVKDNMNTINFPYTLFNGNIQILEGILLKWYGIKLITPNLFVDKYDNSKHGFNPNYSDVLRNPGKNIYENHEEENLIVDFTEIGYHSNELSLDEKPTINRRTT